MRKYRFWSDTNQTIFENALDDAGIEYAVWQLYTVVVTRDLVWVNDLARSLGAD